MLKLRRLLPTAACLNAAIFAVAARAETPMPATVPATMPATRPAELPPIKFQTDVLDNGLTVIYAPLDNAPVVQVRVLYHVGSKDETPDRQGFAHMFEHMMFRGSAHVAPEQLMKLVNDAGGSCNAFTSFDQTTYHDTLPSNGLQMALYLEADRMASFKVTAPIFKTERNVVAEEWRMRTANPPYGTFFQDFLKTAYDKSHYKWAPIGDMAALARAQVGELQTFHDTYYVPNNATLIIAGKYDVAQAKHWVKQYFAWIPKGKKVVRRSPEEPQQTAERELTVLKANIPIARVILGFKTADYENDDHYALSLLGSILGDGASSRLYEAMVGGQSPMAVGVSAGDFQLEDKGLFVVSAAALPGKPVKALVQISMDVIDRLKTGGVTDAELDKAKTQARVGLIAGRQTAEQVATQLGEAAAFYGDPAEVNRVARKVAAVTPADIQRVAQKYLNAAQMTELAYVPGRPKETQDETAKELAAVAEINQSAAAVPASEQPSMEPGEAGGGAAERPVVKPATKPATQPTTTPTASAVGFPADFPTTAPMPTGTIKAEFEKGTEQPVNDLRVIVLPDARLPLVSWTLVMRGGGDAVPAGKEGLAGLTAEMLTRGAADLSFQQLSEDLESRGITLSAGDGGDHTTLSGFATVEQLPHLMQRAKQVLRQPTFPPAEFAKLKAQTLSGLSQALSDPSSVAGRDLSRALYGDTALGRQATPATVASITLDDVKQWYEKTYRPGGAFMVVSGDATAADIDPMVETLTAGWSAGSPPTAAYDLPPAPTTRRIILIDNPSGQQATIRMAAPAYTLTDPSKFAGSVASRVLSGGIESRMNKYLRAELGLTYGAGGYFSPGRHAGTFTVTVATKPATAGEAIVGAFKVLKKMADADIEPSELTDTQRQVAGSMVMETQTVGQQASRRVDVELNGYPIDYFDVYPQKIAAVTADQVRGVMDEYVKPDAFTIVIVGPASIIKPQVDQLGEVQVLPMPLQRAPGQEPGTTTRPATDK